VQLNLLLGGTGIPTAVASTAVFLLLPGKACHCQRCRCCHGVFAACCCSPAGFCCRTASQLSTWLFLSSKLKVWTL